MLTRVVSRQALEFACQSRACAPPPVGSGGSKATGGGGRSGGSGGSSSGGSPSGDRFDQEVEYEQKIRAREKQRLADNPHIVQAHESPHFKVRKASDVPGAMTQDEALALVREKDATGRRVLDKGVKLADDQVVGVRANLNLKKSTGVTVQTLHQGSLEQLRKGTGLFTGEAIGYGASPMLRDAQFSVNQNARAKILLKEANKFPMASVDGKLVNESKPNGARAAESKFNGVEIKFNPMKNHTFVDPDGRAVKSATDVTVVGSSVFARGQIEYYTPANMPKPARDLPSESRPYEVD